MAAAADRAPLCVTERGAYLTDGTRLFRVISAGGGEVLLEDCRFPEMPAVEWSVAEVLERLRLVRRAESAAVS